MFHPDSSSAVRTVRDGRSAPVTCAACGCRLQEADDGGAWLHFNPIGGRDARGCRVACADLTHESAGLAVGEALLA